MEKEIGEFEMTTLISQTVNQLDQEFLENGMSYQCEEQMFQLKGLIHRYYNEKYGVVSQGGNR